MDAPDFRAHFPVLERIAYMNAGTDGPVATVAVEAAAEELRAEARDGRVTAHFERRIELQDELRAAYGRVAGAPPEQIALTTSATDGIGRVIAGIGPGPGRRGRDLRPGAPGAARPAAAGAPQRRTGARGAVGGGPHRRRRRDDARGALARELGRRRRHPAGPLRAVGAAAPRRRPGRGRDPGRRPRARLRRPTPPRARSGCAGRTARASSGSTRRSPSGSTS